jgi:hypothetical protein
VPAQSWQRCAPKSGGPTTSCRSDQLETTKPKFYRYAIVRHGQLREPLFFRLYAPWDKVGPLVKQIMDQPRNRTCGICKQSTGKHDDKTVFLIVLGYDENDKWLDAEGGACCERCSQLSDYELRKILFEA